MFAFILISDVAHVVYFHYARGLVWMFLLKFLIKLKASKFCRDAVKCS